MSIKAHPPQHIPVLLDATLRELRPQTGESYLDLTAGYGGHALAILQRTGDHKKATLVDRDDYAHQHLSSLKNKGARLMHTDFLTAARQLEEAGESFDIILVDLGVSSPQLDQGERGFSFTKNGPLDMRMDRRQTRTAADIVNTASADELASLIAEFGEEPYQQAKRIAQLVIAHRPLSTTKELADLIASNNYRRGNKKIHPATRTFQALRIAVNDELEQIKEMLQHIPKLLNEKGRVGIISFHSLEDRLVKQFLKEQMAAGYEAELTVLTKKPLSGANEDVHNPRSRSAKLRVAVKK